MFAQNHRDGFARSAVELESEWLREQLLPIGGRVFAAARAAVTRLRSSAPAVAPPAVRPVRRTN